MHIGMGKGLGFFKSGSASGSFFIPMQEHGKVFVSLAESLGFRALLTEWPFLVALASHQYPLKLVHLLHILLFSFVDT